MLYGIVNNDLSVVRHLIDSGADVNAKDQVLPVFYSSPAASQPLLVIPDINLYYYAINRFETFIISAK